MVPKTSRVIGKCYSPRALAISIAVSVLATAIISYLIGLMLLKSEYDYSDKLRVQITTLQNQINNGQY